MKKNSIIIIIIIITVILLTYFNYKTYTNTYNEKLLSIITNILEENPSIDINNIINSLKNNNNESNLLEEYGYDKEDLYLINDLENKYNTVLIINITIVLALLLIYIKIQSNKNNKRKKEIEELINYLEKINNGDYNINLEVYTEGEYSRLRDQIYKTTIILKENANNLLVDKKNLKNNIADISHQLKTPLTSIMLMTENIQDKNMTPSKRKEYINKISDQTDKMKYLIDILLKISRLDASVVEFKQDNVKSTTLINNSIKNLEYLIKEKNININKNIEHDKEITCDKKWQEEALTNILKNSIEHSNTNGVIDITITNNNFYSKIIIKDYGKGISKELQKQIFDRFKKSEASTGIGIGLNLAKTIIEKDNGIITVKSELNKYTQFEIKYKNK